MKKGILGLLAWSLPFLLFAQNNASAPLSMTEEGKGIKWTTGLSWEQIKQKAKRENKYIFVDVYATWCGPCKLMDQDVYPNDTVADFFNQHFIPVKVQMDKTEDDAQTIKNWYKDAKQIEKEYAVNAFPSLMFLSPESMILYRMEGYRPPKKLVDTAKLVLTNGTVYNDPYKEYRSLVSEYNRGIKHYDRMPYMIKMAGPTHDTAFSRQLFKEYLDYASGLNEKERYTKENIELWSSFILKLDSKALQFFLKDGDKIDQVMGQKEFSINVVNATIRKRIVDSFFRMQKGVTTLLDGTKIPNSEIMFVGLTQRRDGKITPDYVEADWKQLEKMISEHFGKGYAIRNVYWARWVWYSKHQNKTGKSKAYFGMLDKYPPADLAKESDMIDAICWDTFLYVNDKKLLRKAVEWIKKIIPNENEGNYASYLDTYANLLYKLGNIKEAIEWQEKAVAAKTKILVKLKVENVKNEFAPVLEKMKKGEPTYLEQGAIWLNK